MAKVKGKGTEADPWMLRTPPGSAEYTMYRAPDADPPALVCHVGKTQLRYHLRCLEDLHAMLCEHGEWMLLGSTDEGKDPKPETVEAWARASDNPVGGWYGLRKRYRGRFANYVPPLMEALGLAELTHEKRNNKMRALPAVEKAASTRGGKAKK